VILSCCHNQRGATLLTILVMMVLLGLAAGMAGTTWKTARQREREAELLFRGDQYRRAIEGYYRFSHGGMKGLYPARLEDLIKDPRSLETRRHIRQLFNDPMTGGDWVLITEPGGRIRGVRSSSQLEPFQQDNFAQKNERFVGAREYAAWEFVYEPPAANKTNSSSPKTGDGTTTGNAAGS